MNKFQVGNVVKLKSGGPNDTMTVREQFKPDLTDENYEEHQHYVWCDWYEGDTLKRDTFHEDELILVD